MPFTHRTSTVSFALKTLTSALTGAVLLSATANAAGLGKLTVLSALGQPLRAEIELTAVAPEEAGGLVAQLAPAEAFRTANIDFNPALSSLRFEVEQRNGRPLIRVSSPQPLNEPFVDLLLELKWNGGRMVREYTFLLDAADARSAQSPQVAAPVELGRPAGAPAAAAAPASASASTPAAGAAARPSTKAADQVTVKKGDNLTRIANQVKPVDISLDMMLVALYRANPEAFSGNNMNRLKSGQILKVPEADAIRASAPEGEARGVVVAHALDFNAYRAKLAGQVAASAPAKEPETGQNAKGKISAKVEEKPNAVNEAKDKLTLSKSTAAAPVEGKTGLAAEERIAKQKQAEEADARVKELEKNVNDLEKLMTVKGKPVADKPVAAAPVAAAAPAPAGEAAEPPQAKRTPVVPPKRFLEPSWYEVMMDNLRWVGLGLAALLALVVGLVLSRRRKKFVVVPGEIELPPDPTTPVQPFITEAPPAPADAAAHVAESGFAPSASQLDNNEVDPIAEADVYIAYGRDAQAEDILKEALRIHPERLPVRLKLLEIYATRKDARAFESQASELYSMTRGQGDEWGQAAAMGQALDPTNPLYTAAADAGGALSGAAVPLAGGALAAAAASAYSANDFGTGDDFGAEPAAGPDRGPDGAVDGERRDLAGELNDDLGGDMETALPQPADASISPASVAAQSDDLMDFDLGDMRFEPVAKDQAAIELPASAPASDQVVDDPFDLDFDAPASPAPAPAASTTAAEPADDPSMDFSLDLPAEPAEKFPAASTDPLDMDITGFDIAEVPALIEPPKTDATAEPDDLPEDEETAPAATAKEFDLSDINLDLDELAGRGDADSAGSAGKAEAEAQADQADQAEEPEPAEAIEAAKAAAEPAEPDAPGRDDTMSAHHMEMDTKLDLAIAYQEIGDKEGARELLDEVLRGGNDDQIAKANAMKAQLG